MEDDENDNFYGTVTQHMSLQGRLGKRYVTCCSIQISLLNNWTYTAVSGQFSKSLTRQERSEPQFMYVQRPANVSHSFVRHTKRIQFKFSTDTLLHKLYTK